MNNIKRLLTCIISLSILLSVSSVSFSADGNYSVDPDYEYLELQLGGTSTNDHTSPIMMWYYDGYIYFAVNSSHDLQYMTVNDYTMNVPADADVYGNQVPIIVDGVSYLPNNNIDYHNKNHWTVFKAPKTALDLQESNTTLFIKGLGGGHDVTGNTLEIIIPKVTVNVEKTWINGPMTSIEVSLKRYTNDIDDVEVVDTVTLTPDENHKASYTWTNQRYTNPYGYRYTYLVKENDPGEGYTASQTEYSYNEATKTYTIKIENNYESPTTSVTGHKEWVVDDEEQKKDIELQLYRKIEGEEREAVGDSVVLLAGQSSYTWEDVPLKNLNAIDYIYSIDEVVVPEGFRKIVSDDGLTVTNIIDQEMPETGGRGTAVISSFGIVLGLLGCSIGIFRKYIN